MREKYNVIVVDDEYLAQKLLQDYVSKVESLHLVATCSNAFEAMEALKNHFTSQEKYTRFMDFDGYRIEFADWWFNVRPSNTEPYLRLLLEAKNEQLLKAKVAEARQVLSSFVS